jgi:hypothetical protein
MSTESFNHWHERVKKQNQNWRAYRVLRDYLKAIRREYNWNVRRAESEGEKQELERQFKKDRNEAISHVKELHDREQTPFARLSKVGSKIKPKKTPVVLQDASKLYNQPTTITLREKREKPGYPLVGLNSKEIKQLSNLTGIDEILLQTYPTTAELIRAVVEKVKSKAEPELDKSHVLPWGDADQIAIISGLSADEVQDSVTIEELATKIAQSVVTAAKRKFSREREALLDEKVGLQNTIDTIKKSLEITHTRAELMGVLAGEINRSGAVSIINYDSIVHQEIVDISILPAVVGQLEKLDKRRETAGFFEYRYQRDGSITIDAFTIQEIGTQGKVSADVTGNPNVIEFHTHVVSNYSGEIDLGDVMTMISGQSFHHPFERYREEGLYLTGIVSLKGREKGIKIYGLQLDPQRIFKHEKAPFGLVEVFSTSF